MVAERRSSWRWQASGLRADVWLDVLPWMRARAPTQRYAAAFSLPALQDLLTDEGVQDRTLDSHHHPATSAAPSGQGMMTMVKGGTEFLQDPVAQELLASRFRRGWPTTGPTAPHGWCPSGFTGMAATS
jgi:hypothetical protein